MDERPRATSKVGKGRPRIIAGVILLFLLPLLAYAPAYHAGFYSDDEAQIVRNPRLGSNDGLADIWTDLHGTDGTFYPLTFTTFWLEHRFWGLNPRAFHADNILLHALNAVLLWLLLRRLRVPASWMVSAIFSLHPVQVETVAWVTERRNTLSTVFYLLSIFAYLEFRPIRPGSSAGGTRESAGRSLILYALSLALFVAALLSKTATLSLPLAILLITWWQSGRVGRRDLTVLIPFIVVAIGAGFMTAGLERNLVEHGGPGWGTFSRVERMLIAGRAVWFYLGKLVVPFNLSFVYPRWEIDASSWSQYAYPAAAIALPFVCFALRRRFDRGVVTGVLFFGVTLLPVLGLINYFYMMISFVADRFLYLPSVGIIPILVAAVARSLRVLKHPHGAAVAASIVVIAGLGALTWSRSECFKSAETVYRDVLAKHPDSWVAHYSLGANLAASSRAREAIPHLEEALRLKPGFPSIRGYLAVVYSQVGRQSEALPLYAEALRQSPRDVEIRTNLGMTYTTLGRYDEAIEEYERALEINPHYAPALKNLERLVLYRIDSLAGSPSERDDFVARMQALARRVKAEDLARQIALRATGAQTP
jgi:hypothetical protein